MSRAGEQARLWLPHYWPAWLGLGLFWLADKLPWPEKRLLARGLGWVTYHFIRI
ncbi:MAG: htrB, partial [Lacunisphaera sp.]|nr:htrB [Lacunisphaera sp.]